MRQFDNFLDRVAELIGNRFRSLPIFAVIMVPVIALVAFSLVRYWRDLTSAEYADHATMAQLAANTLESQFDQLVNVGVALADRKTVKESIIAGQWDAAAENLEKVLPKLPLIDRIILFDPDGILKKDIPPLPGAASLLGQSFAGRDWYKGVSKNWEPYISEIFKRMPEPRLSVAGVTIPIKSNDGTVIGIMLMPIPLDTFSGWAQGVEFGVESYLYFVDQAGQVAGNPRYPPQGEIINYSSWDIVQKMLQGGRGVEISTNPSGGGRRFAAY